MRALMSVVIFVAMVGVAVKVAKLVIAAIGMILALICLGALLSHVAN